MRPIETKGMRPFVLFGLVFALLATVPARAGEILDAVTMRPVEQGVELIVTLRHPFAVRRHFPRRRGEVLQLQLQARGEEPAIKRRERLSAPSQAAPLVEVVYEGNVRGGPFLVLRFAQVVEFEVPDERAPARKTLRVRLLGVGAAPATTDAGIPSTRGEAVVDRAEALYRRARAALTRGENDQAVLLFSQLLELPDNPFSRESLEYLGVARERSGQGERARQIYQDYLQRYPDSPRAATVRQRLLALEARLGLREAPRLRRSERRTNPQAPAVRRDHFGRVYQVIYNAFLKPENGVSRRARRQSLTYADLSIRRRGLDSQWRTVLSGSYEYDFLAVDDADERPARFRIRSAYLDYEGERRGLDFTLGRQAVPTGGVFGRFDGARLAYRVHRAVRLNAVAGAPVDYLDPERVQTQRPLVGVGLALEEPMPYWNANAYLIEQRADGLVDRRATGADLRYFRDDRSAFLVLDYDLGYRVLNIITAHLGKRLGGATRLNLHLDHRRSPTLLTSNALRGVTDIPDDEYPVLGLSSAEALRAIKADPRLATLAAHVDERIIRDRALANTGETDLVTLGLIHDLGPRVQVNGNLNWTRTREAIPVLTTEDLLAVSPPRTVIDDRSINTQLVLRDYLVPRDMFLLSLKLGDTSTQRIASVGGVVRRPFGPLWRLEGRLRVEYTRRKGDETWRAGKVSPAVKLDYRPNKRLALDLETGLDWYRTQRPNGDYRWTYFNLGLQLNF